MSQFFYTIRSGGFSRFLCFDGVSRAHSLRVEEKMCASQEDEVGEWKRVGMISNDAFARSFGVFERRVFLPLLVVDPSPLHFFSWQQRRGARQRLQREEGTKKRRKKTKDARARVARVARTREDAL